MTHLKIELNNGIIEEVSSAVIDKLYDIVHSGNLDNTSNLIGRLHTSATYQDYIDYLEDTFKVNGVKLLIIDATKKYIRFADPEVLSYWANSTYGDGTGIDVSGINSVLSIPANAFKDNTNIESFNELSSFINCTTLDKYSFHGCTNLTSIDLSNITSFVGYNFWYCSNLKCVNLNNNYTVIGEWGVFRGCTELIDLSTSDPTLASTAAATYTFNGNIVPYYMFAGCKLTNKSFNIPNATKIMLYAFASSGVVSVNAPNLVKLVGYTFKNCTSLTSVALGNVTEISDECFNGCTALTTVTVGSNSSIVVGMNAFCNCSNLTDLDVTKIVSLSRSSLYGCSSLVINNPDMHNVTQIGTWTFGDCVGLTGTLDLSGVTTLYQDNHESIFAGCTGLTKIVLGHISKIGTGRVNLNRSSFYLCNALKVVDITLLDEYVNSITSLIQSSNTVFEALIIRNTISVPSVTHLQGVSALSWSNIISSSCATYNTAKIYVPDAMLSAYLNDSEWGNIASHIDVLSNYNPS